MCGDLKFDLEKYKEYCEIAKWKILLLKYGVKFSPNNLFNDYPNIDSYKVKSRVVNVVASDYEVYDKSKDISVIPSEVIIQKGLDKSIVKLRYSENSPITLDVENKKIHIYVDGVKVDIEISLVKACDLLLEKINGDKENRKIGDYIDIVGVDRVSILFFEGCYNWLSGKPCKFCDLHPQKETHKPIKPSLNLLKNYDFDVNRWWNDCKEEYLKNLTYSLEKVIQKSKLDHMHIFFMAGNMPTNTDVWNIVEETIKYVSKKIDLSKYDSYLNVAPHDNINRLIEMKKLGIKYLQYNLEIVNEKKFNYTCPGKLKYIEFLNKLYEAVDIYGKGNVRSNFVLGLDRLDETLTFAKHIAEKGIVFDYSVFQPKRNTEYYNKEAPDFDDVIYFTEKLVEIYKKYNYNPIFCSLSSRSSIVNELYCNKKGGIVNEYNNKN